MLPDADQIIAPIYYANVGILGPNQAFLLAYQVALAGNVITGLTSIVFGIVGPQLLRIIPPAALMVLIAGLGISFL